MVASHTGNAGLLWDLETQMVKLRTFGPAVALDKSFLKGTCVPGLDPIPPVTITMWPVICLKWITQHPNSCLDVLVDQSVVVSHETHTVIYEL